MTFLLGVAIITILYLLKK
ncbi:hypothetical protein [Victivallis vadensis]